MPSPPPLPAAILSVGDELSLGQALDTNTQSIADALTAAGVVVVEHATVPDDLPLLTAAIARLADGRGLLVITGGLGPTSDDLTRHALADAMNDTLVEDAAALAAIESYYTSRGRAMPPANRVQAMRPASARLLDNPNGTAPGLAATIGHCRVFCLPGPPSEMEPMLEREVLAAIARTAPILVRTLRTVGRGESDIAGLLAELMDRDRPILVGTTASLGVVTVRVRTHDASLEPELDDLVAEIRRRLGPVVFSDGPDLAAHILDRLRHAGQTLGTVESCTAGLLGQMITEAPGSSIAYIGGLISYTNRLKQQFAAVPEAVLQRHGAVSGQCASAMAEGGRRALGVDHCLAITGIAGPGGGTAAKPVGTVFIALASAGVPTDSCTDTRHFLFRGPRDAIRRSSATAALAMLRLRLDGVEMRLPSEREE